MRYVLFVWLINSCIGQAPLEGASQGVIQNSTQTFSHWIGDREVKVSVYQKPGTLTFVNLHDDENTSVEAARLAIDSLGGTLIQLEHTGERNIEFLLEKTQFVVDPNRIFTDVGASASLRRLGSYSDQALNAIRTFAERMVDSLSVEVIYTLHNNGEEGYSAKSYLNEYKTDAEEVFLNPTRDEDDFYFVTDRVFFEKLKAKGYNVVLQNNETVTDDGSLSVLAGWRGIPYINIEAQHGHLQEQLDMLFVLYSLFD
jgi:hypothetical protein